MKTSLVKLLFLFHLCAMLQNCGPDCNANCTTIKEAPQEFLDYWYFPEGSWWVYQLEDSTQDIFDTVRVLKNEREYSELDPSCNEGIEPCLSSYEMVVAHSSDNYFPGTGDSAHLWGGVGWEGYRCRYNSVDNYWALYQFTGTYKLHSYETFLKYPFQKDEVYFNESYLCKLNDTFLFQGKTHSMLTVCNDLKPVGDRQFFNKMSFAKGIGLVSVTYNHQETWELVDYHTNQ